MRLAVLWAHRARAAHNLRCACYGCSTAMATARKLEDEEDDAVYSYGGAGQQNVRDAEFLRRL